MPVVEQQAPQFTLEEAVDLARSLYGLTASARSMPSYVDQNFLLEDADGRRFVLKVANAVEDPAVLDLQQQAMDYLATHQPEAAFPRVCRTTMGAARTAVEGGDGTSHTVWMVTYLPGRLLAEVKPHTPGLLHSLGRSLGAMDRTLAGFAHPAMHRVIGWDLKQALSFRPYLAHIEDEDRRALVARFLDHFEVHVVPHFPDLRTSVIHNDANDYNVLVEGVGWEAEVAGLIDFGDMAHTYTVCELAIGATYAMFGKADPLAAAAQVVGGYHAAYPLTEREVAVLYGLIATRLCISVLTSAHRRTLEPDNAYISISEQPAWAMLTYLADLSPGFAHYTFREVCSLPPCPQTPRVVQWLRDNAASFHPVVTPDPQQAPSLVLDLSAGSPLLGTLDEQADLDRFTARLFGQMRAANASLGIGRYDEARLVYTADQYRSGDDETAERRTIHLGLDVFQEAGAVVLAPLDGIIHSFVDNARPLDYGPAIIVQHEADAGVVFYTLYGHLSRASLEGLYEGKAVCKGERLGTLGTAEENGGWVPHLHFQLITDMLAYRGDFPGVARPSERAVWLSLSPDSNLILRVPADRFPDTGRSKEAILDVRARHLGRNLSVSYHRPLKIVRGFMQYLYDEEGRAYLDAVNNVPHVGHSHPRVVRAAQEQMAVLNTNTRYLHDYLARYAERLTALLPDPLQVCFFVNSGSEANDLALRLARAHTGQRVVIVLNGAYHGNLSSLIEISPYKFDGPGGAGVAPHVHKVVMPDPYRGPYRSGDPQAGERYAAHVREAALQAQRQGGAVAAFIAESLLSCGGQIECPAGYLQAAYRHVRAAGGVCIADEVQVGFGRVGTHFWGFETQGVVPDVVVMGKPIGNGHPLAAVVTTPEIAASFDNGMEYFNTFGGNPVSCAVGLAVLDVIEAEGLQERAWRVGSRLKAGLERLKATHPMVGDVRGRGLFLGVELVLDRETLAPAAAQATYVVNRMREEGILISTDGPLHNVLKIKPPLAFSDANADLLVRTLDAVLAEDAVRVGRVAG